ncbi:MAG: HAD family hydrolase [Pirellulaceae bacterium]
MSRSWAIRSQATRLALTRHAVTRPIGFPHRVSRMSLEPDFQRRFPVPVSPTWLGDTRIEQVRDRTRTGFPRVALFDFDGTLSLIREGWPEIMIPMMVEELQAQGAPEPTAELEQLVGRFVHELTGKQTIYQMMRLAEEVRARGGTPREPLEYKQRYHDLLTARITERREDLRSGRVGADAWLVPGSRELLEGLFTQGVELYLASGTDLPYVREGGRAARADSFLWSENLRSVEKGRGLLEGAGDPTDLVRRQLPAGALGRLWRRLCRDRQLVQVGALAVGVASDERARGGKIDPWKRERLILVGAHRIVADYAEQRPLLDELFAGRW